MSANHQEDIKIEKKIIINAKDSGADAVKIQTYNASSITLNCDNDDFKIDNNSPWSKSKTLYNLYDVAQTPFKWHDELFRYASALKITIFSSPFDIKGLKLLEQLKCPIYKIASPEITDIPLIKEIAKTRKPVMLSTGLAEIHDIELAALCNDSKTAWATLGKVDYGRKSSEEGSVKFRRSLYFVKDMKEGDIIAADAVRSVRPGFGLAPKFFDGVIGMRVKISVAANTPVLLASLESS